VKINNATSTKQTVSAGTGVVVLASDNVSGFYLHNTIAPTAAPPGPTNPGGPATTVPGEPRTETISGPTTTTTGTSAGGGSVTGQGTGAVARNVCPVNRSAVVRWIPPKRQRMVSIVVNVAGRRYAKLKGSRHSIAVHLGKLPGPFRIEIRGRAGSGRVYAAVSTVSGCSVPSARAHRLVRVVHKR
jgi:hypothetical protein